MFPFGWDTCNEELQNWHDEKNNQNMSTSPPSSKDWTGDVTIKTLHWRAQVVSPTQGCSHLSMVLDSLPGASPEIDKMGDH